MGSDRVRATIESLQRGRLLKIIAGAAVNDPEDVYRLTVVACAAGVDMIDVCADDPVVRAACRGRDHAVARFGDEAGRTTIMASPTLAGDVHRLKAILDPTKCTNCNACLPPVCPDDCILAGSNVVIIDTPRCRGCDACVEICPHAALRLEPLHTPPLPEAVAQALRAGAEAIELHLSGEAPHAVRAHLEAIWLLLNEQTLVSVCVGSQQSSPAEVLNTIAVIDNVRRGRPIVIQADGSTMGGRPGGIQALALAEFVTDLRLNDLYVIASGSVSELTWETATRHNIAIGGLGIGIRARELVREALIDDSIFKSDPELLAIAGRLHTLRRPLSLDTVTTGRAFRGPALAKIGAAKRRQRPSLTSTLNASQGGQPQ